MISLLRRSVHSPVFLLAFMAPVLFAQDLAMPKSQVSEQSQISDLSAGKVRSAVDREKSLISAHPEDPGNYINLAYTLSDAGMGEISREAALKATQICPRSSEAFNALGWVPHRNLIGVNYGKGYAYDDSIAAYRKAIELASGDMDVRQNLANNLEFNEDGIQYASNSRLTEAIEIYRYIKAHQNPVEPDVEDNLLIDLFHSGQFKEVITEMAGLQLSSVRDGILIAAIAADQGSTFAIERANQTTGDTKRRNAALNFAAEGLTNMRLYPQAAELLTAGIEGQGDSSATLRKIQILRTLKPFHGDLLPDSDPRNPAQRHLMVTLTGGATEAVLSAIISKHAYADQGEWAAFMRKANEETGVLQQLSIKTGLPLVMMRDIVLGTTKIIVEPSDQPGYRIAIQTMIGTVRLFVVNEAGVFKIVATNRDTAAAGSEALYLLHNGQETAAQSLLNWKRDQIQKSGDDDPLNDVPFAQLWIPGKSKGPDAIKTAAASLLMDSAEGPALLPYLLSKRNQLPKGQYRSSVEVMLAHIYLHMGDGHKATSITRDLLSEYPTSATAIRLAGRADSLIRDWPAWALMLESRLPKQPNDRFFLVQMAEEAVAEGDFARARKRLRAVLDSGHALADDYNLYAWLRTYP